jgi:hypothetical protein
LRTPAVGLTKCAFHCGLSKAERDRIADDVRITRQANAELARLQVEPVANSLDELRFAAGVAHAWLVVAAGLINRLTADSIRYEGKLRGEQLRSEVALWERALERVADINAKIARLNLDERLTLIRERDFADIVAALRVALQPLDPATRAVVQRAFADRIRALHDDRKVVASPFTAIPGRVIPDDSGAA